VVDHPFTFYSDLLPELLIDRPEVRFFEVCNNGARWPIPPGTERHNYESFWDVVNAFRCRRGQPLLYGIAADDAHFFGSVRDADPESSFLDGYVMVRSEKLDPPSLITAMEHGDFYASCGVMLEEVEFNSSDGTLSVEVKPEPELRYRIDFVVTPRDFSEEVTYVHIPAVEKLPERNLPLYSEDIGQVAASVEGTKGSYQLRPDDLYVRARIVSDRISSKAHRNYHAQYESAWTQPYRIS